jgi:hypothetical protein
MDPIGAELLFRYLVLFYLELAYFMVFAMLCAGGGKSQSFKNFLAE